MHINFLNLNILNLRVHENAWHDSWLGEADHEEGPEAQKQTQ